MDTKSSLRDLTGQRFGKLVVIERTEDHITPSGKHLVKWLCKCDCGKKTKVLSSNLKNNITTSCGCVARKIRRTKRDTPNRNAENYIGKVFGLLTVVEEIKPYRSTGLKIRCFKCQCYCGKFKNVRASQLTSGVTVSCGCISSKKLELLKDFLKNHNNE